jgi:hypothetical protein
MPNTAHCDPKNDISIYLKGSKYSVVTIVNELQAARTRNCGLIPGSDKRFFAFPKLKAGSVAYPPANYWVMGLLSLGAKLARGDSGSYTSSTAEVKNG